MKEAKILQIQHFVLAHILETYEARGSYQAWDQGAKMRVVLKYLGIHKEVSQIAEDLYFVCADFEDKKTGENIYDLDIIVRESNGNLEVEDVTVHKITVKRYDWDLEGDYLKKG